MTNTLSTPTVRDVLTRLHGAADADERAPHRAIPAGADAQELADLMADIYMPISARGGELLYSLIRAARPETVVEFGTSYGISTLYLAAAVADNGVGHVYGTEMSATKLAAAQDVLAEAGLADHVTILHGDARSTLDAVPGPIGLVLLDGWKDLCLPVLRSLEPRLTPGALVVADDTTMATMAEYLDYVRTPGNGYVSVDFPVEDGMEISCRA
ncbi:O-methyltransferase [Actinocrispum wychmicini]|uniref:Putative O-methyltransferase YrrM n=1 Tax=Actinocrispum wychmicini TaxID=1213861 RepID=A0A4V2S4V7_9PSEU|nr:class I SAM-dependent methyltransferase [Actinocrispum wychmicini]TCO49730.1 putative O-methyltransferase YrrM [Actinocrispum wychmicini]